MKDQYVLKANLVVLLFSHRDPVCDEETLPEGLPLQPEEQRRDSRAAGHVRRGGRRRDGH